MKGASLGYHGIVITLRPRLLLISLGIDIDVITEMLTAAPERCGTGSRAGESSGCTRRSPGASTTRTQPNSP